MTVAGIPVIINPEKPRKGSFVIFEEGNETPLFEMLGLERPFTKLKALNMDELSSTILSKLAVDS